MLAAQLAKNASLNSNSFQSKRNTESYLFTPQQARHHDLDALYQLAQNGLQLLSTSSGHLKTLKTSLLLPSSKFTDRTTLSKEENALIDREVETLLFAISPFLTEPAASKIVEWLVRRFRVNEFNVDTVLAVFLPYHTTDHFIKMVSILHIPGSSPWSFLNPYKKAVTPLHRDSLVKEMLSNHLLANSVVKILLEHVHAKQEHRAVINFVLSTTMRYITHIIPDRVHVSPLLSVLIQAMTKSRSFDTVSACILLVGLTSSRVSLSKDLLDSILATLTSLKVKIDHKTLISGTSLILRHQSGLSRLPAPLFGAILELSSSGDGIKTYEAFLTSSGFLSPLSMSLCSEIEKEGSLDLLLALAASKHLTRQGAGILCSTVLQAAVRCSSQSSMSFFSVVNRLHQLFPQEMHSAVISVQKDDDILQTDDMEAFLSNLIQPLGSSVVPDSHNRMILASSSDPFFRAQGIRRVLDDYNETSSLEHTSERAKMKDLLLSSLRDPDTNVLEALYSSPPKLLEIAGVDAVLDRLENVLSGSQGDTSSDLFTKHIQFILRLTLDKPQDLLRVSLILAQQLLVTKANFKRSTFVWNHLQTNESSDLSSGLFRGVVNHPEIDWSEIKGNVEEISHLNEIFVLSLTENIVKTAQYDQVVTYLLAMARIPEAIPTQFSLVVLFFLLGTVDDTRQLDLGIHLIQLFEGVDITTLHINSSKHVSQAGIPTIDFARIVSKSGHNSTLTRIYTSILLRLSKLPKPSADLAIWVDHSSNVPMARAVLFWSNYYSLLNSSNAFSPILTPPLHNIFLTLQEETLPLLVHTWMSPSAAVFTRVVGLRHTEAFIRSLARSDTDSGNWDFQLLFPFFLTAICDTSQEIRSAAINCLRVLEPESHVESESPAEIFGLSGIPESILGELKFLDNADFRKYMKNLMKSIESVELDVGAIASLHQEILQVDEDDTGKLSRHKQRVLSYLFSHACGWPNLQVRLAILESTSAIKTTSRLPLLHHLIIELSQRDPAELLEALQPTQRQVYVDRLLLALETFSPEQVEADMPTLLPSLFDILKTYVLDPERLAPLQGIMGAMRSITVGLGPDYCQQLCHVVLSIERRPSSEQALLQLLSTSVEDDTVLVEILQQLRSDMPPERPSKRARTDSVSPLAKLLMLCHAITLSSSAKSSIVLDRLLSNLEYATEMRGLDSTEIIHAQGVIINALIHVSHHVPPTDSKGVQLRIDVVVAIIKDSGQPHLVHQALLLVAALVPWSSESLVHHIMPILLSTGSYISPRDDAYSARVAEKTLDSVMPVLATYLRRTYSKRSALQIAARPYLAIFVDSAINIPSHRRTSFFVHLISVLGFADFLNPICILLLEETHSPSEGKKIQAERFKLAVSLLESQKAESHMALISDLLEDVLANIGPQWEETINLLSSLRGDSSEQHVHSTRISRVVELVNHSISHWSGSKRFGTGEHAQRLLSALTRLLAAFDGTIPLDHPETLHSLLKSTTSNALRMLSASTMLFTCLQLLRSNDVALQVEMFEILASRLPDVESRTRDTMSPDLVLLVKIIQNTINSPGNTKLIINALRTLQVISLSARPSELVAVTQLVPTVVNHISTAELAPSAIETLNPICTAIGPRVVPYLANIVETCSILLRNPDVLPKARIVAVRLLRSLIDSTSPFWTVKDVEQLVLACVFVEGIQSTGGAEGVKSLGKHASGSRLLSRHILFTALRNTQDSLGNSHSSVHEELFSLLTWSVKSARQADIENESRMLLSMMMAAWDNQKGTSNAIRAFVEMTIKLNERSFKPLHRILFDWAWTAGDGSVLYSNEHRATYYCQVIIRLLQVLKALITPYLAILITRAIEVLDLWSQAPMRFEHSELWKALLDIIEQSAHVDNGALWSDELAHSASAMLVRQMSIVAISHKQWMLTLLCSAMSSVASVITDPTLLKTLNLDILMQTRSEQTETRLLSLNCLEKLWTSNGRRLVGWRNEAMPFLHECAEDENEDVAAESRRIKLILDQL